jgi:glycosyltransferase involved in cell wall biosynthesis
MPELSAIILTYNEEANLPECLASLAGLNAHIFVVDSGSTDRTLEIARSGGACVVEHPFEHYGAQRNWAQATLPIRTPWVLHLDADERLTPELVCEIAAILRQPPADVDGFLLRKRTMFMGRWMKHGGHYPAYHLRLFRTGKGRCEDRLYDQHFLVDGRVAQLKHDYIDVLTSDLQTWTLRHTRWAALEAAELQRASGHDQVRAAPLGHAIERKRWLRVGVYGRAPLFARAFGYWFYRYVLRRGFLDGTEGLIFHFLQGCWYRFLVDARIYESRRGRSNG